MTVSEKQSKQINGIKGGKRAGAGRKKGVPNKRTAAVQKAVEASGVTPLEFMLNIMRTEPGEIADDRVRQSVMELRFEAAKAAAPYVHPKLAAVEVTGADGGPLQFQKIERTIVDAENPNG